MWLNSTKQKGLHGVMLRTYIRVELTMFSLVPHYLPKPYRLINLKFQELTLMAQECQTIKLLFLLLIFIKRQLVRVTGNDIFPI